VKPGLLVTADGAVFHGEAWGAEGPATGEAIFNTAMSGYQEVISDPSYAGQVVVMTAPHIGNYGVTTADDQAPAPYCSALVTRAMARRHSSWRAEVSLDEYLRRHKLVALSGIDTRRLTRHLRERGAMPVAVGAGDDVAGLTEMAAAAPSMAGQDLATGVGTKERYTVPARGPARARVAVFDFGVKRDILDQLARRGVEVEVVPPGSSAQDVLSLEPDGVFLSNGPGDPEPLAGPVAVVGSLLGRVPLFGICLGHQVLGLALGAKTFKLPFGHHGGNHPVRRLDDGVVEITSQNHGFAVDLWSLCDREAPVSDGLPGPELLPGKVETTFGEVIPTHQNLNDGTLEGLACTEVPAFSVQFHPEAAPGPHDAVHLFDRFAGLMGGR
jgi:carbamoyl-phosphate synthase small subunit